MLEMNEQFPDAVLDSIGKVLVLANDHGLKVAELKRLLRAKKVKKLKFNEEINVNSLVNNVIFRALWQLNKQKFHSHDLYFVSGEDAISTMLNLRTDKVVATIELNAETTKQLHNACLMKQELEKAVRMLESADEQHKAVVTMLKKLKRNSTLGSKSKKITSVVKDYAKTEIQNELQTIKNIMKPSW
jgi:hypothetical protein